MEKKEVVISNSGVNSYGFRVLTSGIDTTQYVRNSILLWMHNRSWRGTTDEVLPLGHMENLRVEGDNLIGTPVFDEHDEFAQRIARKWENGTLKMVSAGLQVIEQSSDPSVLLPTQTLATVTKSKLVEVSIVDIGANDDALVLYHEGKMLTLNGATAQNLAFLEIQNNKNESMNEQVLTTLGLPVEATEAQVIEAINNLQHDAAELATLRAERAERAHADIEHAVEEAIRLKKITADKKNHFVTLGEQIGLASLQETLDAMQPAMKPTDVINLQNGSATEYKKLSDVPQEALEKLYADDHDRYVELYQAEYGVSPQ